MHYRDLFSRLPDESRCWVYIADRPISSSQQDLILEGLSSFFASWTTHGRPVSGQATIVSDRILLVAGFAEGGLSGCGIDSSVHAIEEVANRAGIAWAGPLNIAYRSADGTVQLVPRGAFREQVCSGEVTPATPVFDTSITTVGALREGSFEQPARASWHARVFKIQEPAA